MEAAKVPEETFWRSPNELLEVGGFIHNNNGTRSIMSFERLVLTRAPTVLFYFARSPYFDAMSNNNVVYTQAMNNQSLAHTVSS